MNVQPLFGWVAIVPVALLVSCTSMSPVIGNVGFAYSPSPDSVSVLGEVEYTGVTQSYLGAFTIGRAGFTDLLEKARSKFQADTVVNIFVDEETMSFLFFYKETRYIMRGTAIRFDEGGGRAVSARPSRPAPSAPAQPAERAPVPPVALSNGDETGPVVITRAVDSVGVVTRTDTFVDSQDSGSVIFLLDYQMKGRVDVSFFNPPNGDKFLIKGQVNAGEGQIGFRVPRSKLAGIADATSRFSFSDPPTFVTFHFTGNTLKTLPVKEIPAGLQVLK